MAEFQENKAVSEFTKEECEKYLLVFSKFPKEMPIEEVTRAVEERLEELVR